MALESYSRFRAGFLERIRSQVRNWEVGQSWKDMSWGASLRYCFDFELWEILNLFILWSIFFWYLSKAWYTCMTLIMDKWKRHMGSPRELEDSASSLGQIHTLHLSTSNHGRWNFLRGAEWTHISLALPWCLLHIPLFQRVLLGSPFYSLGTKHEHHHAESQTVTFSPEFIFSPSSAWSWTSLPGHVLSVCSWSSSLSSFYYTTLFLPKKTEFTQRFKRNTKFSVIVCLHLSQNTLNFTANLLPNFICFSASRSDTAHAPSYLIGASCVCHHHLKPCSTNILFLPRKPLKLPRKHNKYIMHFKIRVADLTSPFRFTSPSSPA